MNEKPTIEVEKVPIITKFIYTLGVLPTSYLMSMTYQEQVTWLCNYISQTLIPQINEDVEAIQELQNLFELLRTYVNDYFDNLDVQEEINNKLNQMVSDGTLTDLIKNYVDPIYETFEDRIENEITAQNAIISAIQNTVDSLSSGSPAGTYDTVTALTTADPDHSKIYVVLEDGKWYYYNSSNSTWTAGGVYQSTGLDASTGILKDLYDNIYVINAIDHSICFYPAPEYINRALNTSTGEISGSEQPTRATTKYLYIPDNATPSIEFNPEKYLIQTVCNYDINKSFIGTGYNGNNTAIDPSAKYIRVCCSKRNTSSNISTTEATNNVKIKFISTSNFLYNKVGLSLGDSIMHGSGNNGVGILDLMHDIYNCIVHDYSVGGACIEEIQDKSFINAQFSEALNDNVNPDFILLNGLSNDIVYGTLGNMSSSFDYTNMPFTNFTEALEHTIGRIKSYFPGVPMVYIIPHSSNARDYEDELDFGNRAREVCKKWSIPVADIYKDGNMTARIPEQLRLYTYYPTESGGTHPNKLCYEKIYIPLIVDILKSNFKY